MKLLLIDDSPDAESSLQDLVRQADEALYQAKNSGRDKVCVLMAPTAASAIPAAFQDSSRPEHSPAPMC